MPVLGPPWRVGPSRISPAGGASTPVLGTRGRGVGYDPYTRGTFWGKWLARNPYYSNYRARVYQGYAGDALADMRVRHYIIDRIEGPSDGEVTVTLKDLFSVIEAQKAVAPRASLGELLADISDVAGAATLSPAGIGDLDYPASGTLAIGDECITFTRAGDALTLTGRGALGTTAAAHKAEDLVQLVLVYSALTAPAIVYDLLLNYTSLNPEDLPETDWNLAAAALTSVYTARIATPTPVADLIGELAQQVGFSVWPDVETGTIRITALRPAIPALTLDDDGGFIDGSLTLTRQTERRASQVWVYYGQISPVKALDEKGNYHSRLVAPDLAAESDEEYGQSAIREVFSRWIPQFGRAAAQEVSERIVAMFRDPPLEANFKVTAARAQAMALARYFYLSCAELQDDTGAPSTVTLAAVELERGENEATARAQQVKFATPTAGSTAGTRTVYIENDAFNLDLRAIHDTLYIAPVGGETVEFIIDPGVVVGSHATSLFAIDVGDWPAGVSITLTNRGRGQGRGGNGGNQGNDPGGAGGPVIYTRVPISIDNQGQLWAGGGGGGATFGGGGGGAGTDPGNGGQFSASSGGPAATGAASGTDTAGGTGYVFADFHAGSGGGPGLPGAAATNGSYPTYVGAGGAAGNYIDGNAFVTWINTGDVRGGAV